MLRTVQCDRIYVLAGPNLEAQWDVVAWTKLVHEPAYAVGLVSRWVLMTSHHMSCVVQGSRLGNRPRKCVMQRFSVAMRNIVRVG